MSFEAFKPYQPYTPRKIQQHLNHYYTLLMNTDVPRLGDFAGDGTGGISIETDELICVKADIDKALMSLHPVDRAITFVFCAWYQACALDWGQEDFDAAHHVAKRYGITTDEVLVRVRGGLQKMAHFLEPS